LLLEDRVQLERFPAAEDSDTATSQTVDLMCRYIRETDDDPAIQQAAEYTRQRFGAQSEDPAALAWGVFWFLKHNVRFVVDEAPMFRLGRPNEQDLLISPSVLIRMDDRAGDCDDFTMLGAALLRALHIPYVIVTIAASPDDPSRWSHVFLMAMCPTPLPLDASHGSGPGWMVPAAHTFRWQCWDENGKAISIPRPRKHSLNGWAPRGLGYGLGQDDTIDPESGLPYSQEYSGPVATTPSSYDSFLTGSSSTSIAPTATPSTSTAFNWTSFLNGLTADATSTAKTYITAQQQEQLAQTGAYTASNILGTVVPLAIAGLGIFLVVSMLGRNK
jgi:hypothetical protein